MLLAHRRETDRPKSGKFQFNALSRIRPGSQGLLAAQLRVRSPYPLTQTRGGIPALPPARIQFQKDKVRRAVDRTAVSAREFPGRF